MQLRDVMTPDVYVIRPDATLQEAAQQMKASHVGSLLVRAGEEAIGIITDRDITTRAVAEGRGPTTTKVRDIMTPDVIWCRQDADVTSAINLMKEKHIRHLAVGDEHQNLVGIVSLYSLALRAGLVKPPRGHGTEGLTTGGPCRTWSCPHREVVTPLSCGGSRMSRLTKTTAACAV